MYVGGPGPATSASDLPEWMQEALRDQPDSVVRRFVASPSVAKLDRAMVGIADSVRSDVLRTMLNLGIGPDDEMNVLLALMGYLKFFGEESVRQVRDATADVRLSSEDIKDEFTNFLRSFGTASRKAVTETEAAARSQAMASLQAVGIEELARHRERLASSTETFVSKAVAAYAERTTGTRPVGLVPFAVAGSIVAGLVLVVVLLTWGAVSLANRRTSEEAYQGRVYASMYRDMPVTEQSWVRRWVATHSVPR